ncbi:hypothetical protein ACFFH2_15090 [Enterococcus devriesei]|nr:hypothetical protein [Enterococcus devriesei]MDU6524461.1 hypothetical protein [Enterococcus sp.]
MCAQEKKSRWFSNRTIMDKINAIPDEKITRESEAKIAQLADKIASKQLEEITELKQILTEKEAALQQYPQEMTVKRQRLENENENYKQAIQRWEAEKAKNIEKMHTLEMEIKQIKEDTETLQKREELEQLRSKLVHARAETRKLQQAKQQLPALEKEIQMLQQKCQEAIAQQKNRELWRYNKINQLEKQVASLIADLDKKEEQIEQQELILWKKEQRIRELMHEQSSRQALVKEAAVTELRQHVTSEKKENERLKQEALQSQKEVADVLSSTRKQADRMIGKARYDSQRIRQSSEKEAQQIHTRAREISVEITQTRKEITGVYDDLQSRIDQLKQLNND